MALVEGGEVVDHGVEAVLALYEGAPGAGHLLGVRLLIDGGGDAGGHGGGVSGGEDAAGAAIEDDFWDAAAVTADDGGAAGEGLEADLRYAFVLEGGYAEDIEGAQHLGVRYEDGALARRLEGCV